MSKNLMPIPVGNPVLDNPNSFNIAWQKYLKAIGDDLLTANISLDATYPVEKIVNNKPTIVQIPTGLKYTVNANICACVFHVVDALIAPFEVTLPYQSLLAFIIGGTIYPPGTKKITFNSGTVFEQFWYVVDFGRN